LTHQALAQQMCNGPNARRQYPGRRAPEYGHLRSVALNPDPIGSAIDSDFVRAVQAMELGLEVWRQREQNRCLFC
jgi:hypothetical protein